MISSTGQTLTPQSPNTIEYTRGIADAANFETFVLELIRVHVESKGESLTLTNGLYDAIASGGLAALKGPVGIRCQASPSFEKFRHNLKKFGSFLKSSDVSTVKEVIYIFDAPSINSLRFPVNLLREIAELGYTFTFWTWAELEALIDLHPGEARKIKENLLPLRVRQIVDTTDSDWKSERQTRILGLSERVAYGPSSLFLGAGVSASAGMPDWTSLLNALFVSYLEGVDPAGESNEEETLQLVQRMNELDAPSALVSARYVRKALAQSSGGSNAFTEAIRTALYSLRRGKKGTTSPLIEVLVEMCIPRRSGTLISSVVTYNFDDLFERELLGKSVLHKCIYSASEPPDIDDLPVYHVHGFVPEDPRTYMDVDKNPLVFSEEGYHRLYTDAYHWSNLVQLNALRNSTCVMVGLSMADPNLRRMLEISQRGFSDSRHFAFMKRTTIEKFCAEDKHGEALKASEEKAAVFLKRHHATSEALMSELGVTVIWYEDYDEIPTMLKSIAFPAKSASGAGAQVRSATN
ncbi:SIR2 family protein [Paraburkholderia sediminicola]|nr:SIR2 family protein [Paraburkholderia sediminicola]